VVSALIVLDVTNLKPICQVCHGGKTAGEQILAKRANVAGSKFVRLDSTPSVCGEEMTYDIAVEPPHHNFVGNGIVVHNSYNEESARYKPLDPVFWIPRPDRKMVPVEGWKPGRPKFMTLNATYCELYSEDEPAEVRRYVDEAYNREIGRKTRAYEVAYRAYRESIDDGIAMEVARSVLPVGIYSSCWVTCNPRSLMAFLSLRTHDESATFISYPQAEIEEAARACEAILETGWPLTHRAFVENGRVGP